MTAPNYYVRVRGKVVGPFSKAQLTALRDRGQFRSFHEVSEDRATWNAASTLAGMFAAEPVATAQAPGPAQPAAARPAKAPAEEWYYVDAENHEAGPISRKQLQQLHEAGEINSNSQVWLKDSKDWMTFAAAGLERNATRADVVPKKTIATGSTSGPLKTFCANPITGLPQMCAALSPAAAASWGFLFYIAFLVLGVLSILLSGLVHKTQIFRTIQDLANSPDRFEVVAKLILLAFLPIVCLWGTISILRLITRSHGNIGADGLIGGAVFLTPGLLLPVFVIFSGVSAEVVMFLTCLVITIQVLQFYAAFSSVLRMPDQGIIFAIPAAAFLNAWLFMTMLKLLFGPKAWPWL